MTCDPFKPVTLNPDDQARFDELAREFAALFASIDVRVPPGRYRSLAVTALEQAAMWAVKGICQGWEDT
jgi:hypothetical protein